MISRLRGEIWEVGPAKLVVGCGGVGYDVHVPESVGLSQGQLGAQTELFVRQIVREDDHSLFGFANPDQRRMFDLLREVKGCGAKISLAVIGTLGEETAMAAIAGEDARTLIRVSGVGPRLAERIVVELKGKMQELQLLTRAGGQAPMVRPAGPSDDLVEALIGLGYVRSRVEPIAEEVRRQSDVLEEQIRLALQRMVRS